jgi:hypothetical protein
MKRIAYLILLFLPGLGCIQKFQPTLSSPSTGYLVVEGIINSSGPASVTLTRTTNLSDTSIVYENGAAVQVEGNDNSVYVFSQNDSGIYAISQLMLSSAQQYRLRIKTKAGEQYLSDFESVEVTPAIDSINWALESGGVQIYANTHDPQNNTPYYKWDYMETWEYHSPFVKELNYDTLYLILPSGFPWLGVAFTPGTAGGIDSSVYTCWQTAQSTDILLGSTAALNSNVIADFPISLIPQNSIKLTTEYSILVNQYALSENAYNYLQIMKANTEETGSIFSPQPSQLQGDIHSLSNPAEIVVGFVSFCSIQSKRIFIYNSQLPFDWSKYNSGCIEDSILTYFDSHNPQTQIRGAFDLNLQPTTPLTYFPDGSVNRFLAAPLSCVDCTLSGTNQKPSFWQ